MLNKNYGTDIFDLAELDLHNGIEHDASLTREFNFEHKSDRLHTNVHSHRRR